MFSSQSCMQNNQVWGRTVSATAVKGCFAFLMPLSACMPHVVLMMWEGLIYIVLVSEIVVIHKSSSWISWRYILKYCLVTRSPLVTRKQWWNWDDFRVCMITHDKSLPINEGHIEVLNLHSRTVSSDQLKQIQMAPESTGHINVLLIKNRILIIKWAASEIWTLLTSQEK